ncbi:acyl-CoA dehydrogenase [Pseudohongiella nitratireducens]|uniref:Acyl-CoA dehydrogenase n=1 Tax=Pseudohongiella nitratireducens TaxID=1768907 RepID=A0A917GIW7_9GAMM|nr:acyl-CoA dehydrogenase [Pseudohongiella nitratireducens]GGG48105.1 acyl-CoA dehydrogenase [Pseudohongiella nitratireducens]
MSQELILNRRDLDFMMYEWLDAEALTSHPRFSDHSRETFDAVMDLSAQIANDLFANHNRKNDLNEPTFDGEKVQVIPEVKTAIDAFNEAGLVAAAQDYEYGGMQLPALVEKACMAWFKAANVGSSAYPFLTMANANLLLAHGSKAQIETWVKPMFEGRFFGTMCLSEPQAGSSLADIRTRAEPQGDGTYRLHGNKMWISAGDHELSENIVHLVLAKVPGSPPGVKGISLFIVPRWLVNEDGTRGERNDVALAGLNHKMGYRGTTNTLLNFGEGKFQPGGQGGAVGYCVGEVNKGLACMFHMMNEARVGVGMGAVVLGYTGYLHAVEYAKERFQGRRLTDKDPQSPPVRLIDHTDVKRMLLAQKSYVEGGLALVLYCARLLDEKRGAGVCDEDDADVLMDLLTPIVKSWPSQWCLAANDLAIQVHGGYGYTRDYQVEQFYRDNRLNPIHEGTHGIQGLDLLGRRVRQHGGAGMQALQRRLQMTTAKAAQRSDTAEFAASLDAIWFRLQDVTQLLLRNPNAEESLSDATLYLEAFGHVVVAWIWLDQYLACPENSDDAFYLGKRQACQYFFRRELSQVDAWLDLLGDGDRTCLDMSEGWF